METIGLSLILLIAIIYVFRHVRRMLTVGEDDTKCRNCPVDKLSTKELN
jgi:hypothetical protein